MNNSLSYSQLTKYMFCPASWEYHYKKKVRDTKLHAALPFGSAVGKAVEELVKTRDLFEAEQVFMTNWSAQEIEKDKPKVDLCTNPNLVYANSDFDFELIDKYDILALNTMWKCSDVTDLQRKIEQVYKDKDYIGFDDLPKLQKEFLNSVNWFSMKTKGLVMLQSFNEHILPKITKVYGTEIKAELKNADGDEIIGYADIVCDFKGIDKPVVFDFKTSARDYEKDSVVTSPQLSLYLHALSDQFNDTRYAGYIVLKKQILKNKIKICRRCGYDASGGTHKTCPNEIVGNRCHGDFNTTIRPSATIQVLVDKIPERTEDIVMSNFDMINKSIKAGIFHRNFSNCIDSKRGKCPFYDLCYHNKMDGLYIKGDK